MKTSEHSQQLPPLSATVLAQLRADAADPRAAAQRKGLTMNDWEYRQELAAGRDLFALGCWLHFYVPLIPRPDMIGFKARVECMRRLFLAGQYRPGYAFYSVFDFGERQFDCLVEMGDAKDVIAAVRALIPGDRTGKLIEAFTYMGWPLIEATAQMDMFAGAAALA